MRIMFDIAHSVGIQLTDDETVRWQRSTVIVPVTRERISAVLVIRLVTNFINHL
jgi:hypothetical protein